MKTATRDFIKGAFALLDPQPAQIHVACQPDGSPWPPNTIGSYTPEWRGWKNRFLSFRTAVDANAYIDASLMLVAPQYVNDCLRDAMKEVGEQLSLHIRPLHKEDRYTELVAIEITKMVIAHATLRRELEV